MSALGDNRNTPLCGAEQFDDPCAAAVHVYNGALIVLDSSGNAKPAVTATGLIARGVATKEVDNSAGSAGDKRVKSMAGVFAFVNSAAADEITAAEVGDACYIVDDQTVAKTSGSGTRSVAGKVIRVQEGLVHVQVGVLASADGDLLASNNLSDVNSAATARANLGANKGEIVAFLPSLVAGVFYIPLPDRVVTISKLQVVVNGALLTADLVATCAINTVNITGGAVTVTQAGSAAGSRGEASPSAANVSDGADDTLRITLSGNTAAVAGALLVEYTW